MRTLVGMAVANLVLGYIVVAILTGGHVPLLVR